MAFKDPSMAGINHFRFEVNYSGLEFHREWGINRETGWFALKEGTVLVKFGTLSECGEALGPEIVEQLLGVLEYLNSTVA